MESGDNKMIMEVELQTDNVTTPDPPPCAKNNTDQQGQQQQQQPQQTQGPAQAGQLLGQAELHNQDDDKFVYTCNSCNKSLDTRYVQYSIMIIIVCLIRIKNCQYVASFFFVYSFSGITAINAMTLTSALSVLVVKVILIAWRNLVLTSRARLRLLALTRMAILTGLLLFRDASTV